MFQLTIPLDDIPPPFIDEEVNRHFDFLQNTNDVYKKSKERIPSADRAAVMELASSVDKHRLRRQQQLLLDIAQRCKEQEITDLSSSLSRRCPITTFDQKYHKDAKEIKDYSTNTILFKTWFTPHDGPQNKHGHVLPVKEFVPSESPRAPFVVERGNTFFPARSIKKLPPKEMPKAKPQLQFGYSKGLQVRIPSGQVDKRDLIDARHINGPIQLDLYRRRKSDSLQPLVLPSIKVVGIDSARADQADAYLNAKKVGEELVPRHHTAVGTYNSGPSIKYVEYRKPSKSTPAVRALTQETELHGPKQTDNDADTKHRIPPLNEDMTETVSDFEGMEKQSSRSRPHARDIGYRSVASTNDNKDIPGVPASMG